MQQRHTHTATVPNNCWTKQRQCQRRKQQQQQQQRLQQHDGTTGIRIPKPAGVVVIGRVSRGGGICGSIHPTASIATSAVAARGWLPVVVSLGLAWTAGVAASAAFNSVGRNNGVSFSRHQHSTRPPYRLRDSSRVAFGILWATMESPSTDSSTFVPSLVDSDSDDKAYISGHWRELPGPTITARSNNNTATATEHQPVDPHELLDESSVLNQRFLWSDAAYVDACQMYDDLMACTDSYVAGRIRASLVWIDHALRLYGPDSVLCSFNGGKDAVVILHLVRAALAAYYRQEHQEQQQTSEKDTTTGSTTTTTTRTTRHCPRVVYFDHPDEFPEIQAFLRETVNRYDLDMIGFAQGTKFQDGLRVLVAHNTPHNQHGSSSSSGNGNGSSTNRTANSSYPPKVLLPMAFVLGTRLTDPNAKDQEHFAPSSHYMPPFMRVNPVLDWTYGHVWHFLRLYALPYCKLYDQGYTSLGTVRDTLPCPALAVAGQQTSTLSTSSVPKYWPAYMLRDWDKERAGRLTTEKKAKPTSTATAPGGGTQTSLSMGDDSDPSIKTSSSIGHLSTMSDGRKQQPQNGDEGLPPTTINTIKPEAEDTVTAATIGEFVEDDCVSFSQDDVVLKTAGILIIGDEILKGFTADTNTQVAATALRDNNVVLKSVVVVPDTLDDIVREIQRLRTMVDVVITSGGVGATHDDVTMKSVAAALHCGMELHDEMAQLLRDKMNEKVLSPDGAVDTELTVAQVKMATLPTFAKLRYLSKNPDDWPVLQCKNIFILPGIPEFFSKKIRNVAEYLSCQLERSPAYKIVLQVDENSIVPVLNQVVENHPNVAFGSYPFVSHPEYKTVITVEGRLLPSLTSRNSTIFNLEMLADSSTKSKDADVQLALNDLITQLPEGSVLRVDVDDMRLFS